VSQERSSDLLLDEIMTTNWHLLLQVNGLAGYGAGTTGGGSGTGVTVTSCSALTAAIAAAGVIKISGLLSGCGIMDVKSDTTILGVGTGSGKIHSLLLPLTQY
jgi:pectate lyase